jgi:hypothetical protein
VTEPVRHPIRWADSWQRRLNRFPVVGSSFRPANPNRQHGNVFGLVVGIPALLYGAQGVTQNAEAMTSAVWNVPQMDRPGFLPRLGRSMIAPWSSSARPS